MTMHQATPASAPEPGEPSASRKAVADLRARIGTAVLGQDQLIDRMVIGLLCNGNLLVESLPGLAKTRSVKALAHNLDAKLSRIQFTPDLLPSDVTGAEIYLQTEKGGEFHFEPGPIFANLVLADEINRAPAKVQSALLEAMEERQVTVAGKTRPLPDMFMVLATQNPIEQEGTYPLPEAQMDRFLMHIRISYPDEDAEKGVLRLVRSESAHDAAAARPTVPPLAQSVIFDARAEIEAIHTSEAIETYIVDLLTATRSPETYGEPLSHWLQIGASPRGGLALDKCSRARAWLDGEAYVTPRHVREVLHDCLRHRLILSYEANAEGIDADRVLDEIVKLVAVP
jgi:MoxR-like ATPase